MVCVYIRTPVVAQCVVVVMVQQNNCSLCNVHHFPMCLNVLRIYGQHDESEGTAVCGMRFIDFKLAAVMKILNLHIIALI